jgi:DNA-binding response OmpR family regulator
VGRTRRPVSNVVTVTIHRLRRKLGDPPVVQTITNVGYRITGITS